jgi:hemoglobin-like flavoprotein
VAVTTESGTGRLIRENLQLIIDRGQDLAMHAYDELLRSAPELKSLFAKTDMSRQRENLFEALQFIVLNFDRRTVLERVLGDLGHRHAGYGVRPHHYALFGDSFLFALARASGSSWTRETELAWRSAYEDIADFMLQGADDPH